MDQRPTWVLVSGPVCRVVQMSVGLRMTRMQAVLWEKFLRCWLGGGIGEEVAEEAGTQLAMQGVGEHQWWARVGQGRITDRTGPIEPPVRTLFTSDAACSLLGCAARLLCGLGHA